MENENQTTQATGPGNLNTEARACFLQQGQKISKIHAILNSNILTHHLKKWFSVLLEIIFYLLFFTLLFVVLIIPSNPLPGIPLNSMISAGIDVEQLTAAIILGKIILILLSLPMLGMAILLGRSRKKSGLIRQAFSEVEEMKTGFDKALKDLNL